MCVQYVIVRTMVRTTTTVPFPVPRSGKREHARDLYVDMTQKHNRSVLFLNLMNEMNEYRYDHFCPSRDDDPVP